MNRKGRRAILKRSGRSEGRELATQTSASASLDELHADALRHRRNGDLLSAQLSCRAILTRDSKHVGALIIMGGTTLDQGRPIAALRYLKDAISGDPRDSRAHDNLGQTYQLLGRHELAIEHFTSAVVLGLGNIEAIVKQSAAVSGPMNRMATAWPRQLSVTELFGTADGLKAIAGEDLLIALMQTRVICDLSLERFFAAARCALLQDAAASDPSIDLQTGLPFFRALAQQCFINEYIYPLRDMERDLSRQLRDRVVESIEAARPPSAIELIATAAYQPLHALPVATKLLRLPWPAATIPLLTQQVAEPLEEAEDRDAIPVLTEFDDSGSLANERQYDENPYPRWVAMRPAQPMTIDEYLSTKLGTTPRQAS
jgi:hypothetical protein